MSGTSGAASGLPELASYSSDSPGYLPPYLSDCTGKAPVHSVLA